MTNNIRKAKVDHRKVLEFMITNPIKGQDGFFVAVREIVNNSFDAEAKNISIKFGKSGKENALIIHDDGKGFSKEGIISAMSYAISSRKRDDTSTIGTNGTGLKGLLGLGNLDKTKITIITVDQQKVCYKMEITFDYLVSLAAKKAKVENFISEISIPKDWSQEMIRETGTSVILTGFDGRRMKTIQQITKQFGEFLTPRASEFVRIFDGKDLVSIEPVAYHGKKYEFEFETIDLGLVSFILYCNGSGDGPIVCGNINAIIPLSEVYSKLSREQKAKVPKNLWKTTSGHVYVQKANTFRSHDGSFTEDFYQSSASDQLVDLLEAVGEEIDKLTEQVKDEKAIALQQKLVNSIMEAGRKMDLVNDNLFKDREKPGLDIQTDKDIYLTPSKIRLRANQEVVITLYNHGKKQVDFTGSSWYTNSNLFTITDSKDAKAKVVAKQEEGEGKITIKGSFGEHTIAVQVSHAPVGTFISGPSYVKPGSEIEYILKRYDSPFVDWEYSSVNGIVFQQDPLHPKMILMKVSPQIEEGELTIFAKRSGVKSFIAKKRIFVVNNIPQVPESSIKILGEEYILVVDVIYPDTVAQPDYGFANDEEITKIVINPLHPRIRDLGFVKSLDFLLPALAQAAAVDQISKGLIKPQKALVEAEKFIANMRDFVLKPARE